MTHSGFCVKFGSRRTNQNAEKLTNQATRANSRSRQLLLATARARCEFVHVSVSVRLPSPRALRRNAYIYRASLCAVRSVDDRIQDSHALPAWRFFCEIGLVFAMTCGLISPLAGCLFLGLYVRGTFKLVYQVNAFKV